MASYASWGDVPIGARNLLQALRDQWELMATGRVDIPDWAMAEMASNGVSTIFDFARYMRGHVQENPNWNGGAYFVHPFHLNAAPWAFYGLNSEEYYAHWNSYQSTMMQLVGNPGDFAQFEGVILYNKGAMPVNLLREYIMHDPTMIKTYAWLKHGMTYDDFQVQKTQMVQVFGRPMSNDEAAQQLDYFHRATGNDFTVHPPAPSEGGRRAEPAAIGQSEVR